MHYCSFTTTKDALQCMLVFRKGCCHITKSTPMKPFHFIHLRNVCDVSSNIWFLGTSPWSPKMSRAVFDRINVSSSMQGSYKTFGARFFTIFLLEPFFNSHIGPSDALCEGLNGSMCFSQQLVWLNFTWNLLSACS